MRIDEYIVENKNDLNVKKMAEMFNLSIPSIYRHLKFMNAKPKKEKSNERLLEIKRLRDEGKTYQEIGDIYGISRQRVEQIIHRYN